MVSVKDIHEINYALEMLGDRIDPRYARIYMDKEFLEEGEYNFSVCTSSDEFCSIDVILYRNGFDVSFADKIGFSDLSHHEFDVALLCANALRGELEIFEHWLWSMKVETSIKIRHMENDFLYNREILIPFVKKFSEKKKFDFRSCLR